MISDAYFLRQQMDLIIELLKDLPCKFFDELEKREQLKKALKEKQIRENIYFMGEHNHQINKMMFGYEKKEEE